jgi:hypothetical protein
MWLSSTVSPDLTFLYVELSLDGASLQMILAAELVIATDKPLLLIMRDASRAWLVGGHTQGEPYGKRLRSGAEFRAHKAVSIRTQDPTCSNAQRIGTAR